MSFEFFPLGNATAADIRDIKQAGLLLPLRKTDPVMLLTEWDGKMYAVMLTGSHDFMFFEVKIDHSRTGLFIPEPEIMFDFTSLERGVGYEQKLGDLLLEENKLSIVGARIGDGFRDSHSVPLWPSVTGGSRSAQVVFTKWALGVQVGTGFQKLWERTPAVATTATVV